MKNTTIYYLATLLPFGIIIWMGNTNMVSSRLFLYLILFYVLIYRPVTDGARLVEKGLLRKKDIWKMMIPGNHYKFFKDLYLP